MRANAIAKELEASNFGILCVTRDNLESPWMLFEAGSLANSLPNGHVIPLLLDLEFSEISWPLAQFQANRFDQEGVYKAVESINRAAPNPIDEARAKQLFDALWLDLCKKLEALPAPQEPSKPMRGTDPASAGTQTIPSRADSFLGQLGGEGDDLRALVDGATRVSVLARTAVNLFNFHGHLLRDLAQEGCDVRLLLVAPDVPDVYKYDSDHKFQRNLESTAAHVRELLSSARRRVEVRFTRHAPTMSVFVIEKGEPHKHVVRVQPYFLHSCSGAERPMFTVSGDKRWYPIFWKEFDTLWHTADDVTERLVGGWLCR